MDTFQRNIVSHIQSSSQAVLNPQICPACGKQFATESGASRHLSQSRKCAWYNKRNYTDLTVYPDTEDYDEDLPNSHDDNFPLILDDIILDDNINPTNEEDLETVNIALSTPQLQRRPPQAQLTKSSMRWN